MRDSSHHQPQEAFASLAFENCHTSWPAMWQLKQKRTEHCVCVRIDAATLPKYGVNVLAGGTRPLPRSAQTQLPNKDSGLSFGTKTVDGSKRAWISTMN